MNIDELRTKIITGQMDNSLSDIAEAVRIRRDMIRDRQAAEMRNELEIGQKLWFSATVNPQYLRGRPVEVVQVNRVRVVVRLIEGQVGRYSGQINCKPNQLSLTNPYAAAAA